MIDSAPDDPLAGLGDRLRAERERAGLSLRALAGRLQISASALSQVETGRSRPSVATLYAIASELGVPLDALVAARRAARAEVGAPTDGAPARRGHHAAPVRDPVRDPGSVQRRDERSVLELESGVRWELLTAGTDPDIDFLYVTYAPGGASSDGLITHAGRELGLVLGGELTVTSASGEHVLHAGDSVCLDSTVAHRLRNDGTMPAYAVWAVVRSPVSSNHQRSRRYSRADRGG